MPVSSIEPMIGQLQEVVNQSQQLSGSLLSPL